MGEVVQDFRFGGGCMGGEASNPAQGGLVIKQNGQMMDGVGGGGGYGTLKGSSIRRGREKDGWSIVGVLSNLVCKWRDQITNGRAQVTSLLIGHSSFLALPAFCPLLEASIGSSRLPVAHARAEFVSSSRSGRQHRARTQRPPRGGPPPGSIRGPRACRAFY